MNKLNQLSLISLVGLAVAAAQAGPGCPSTEAGSTSSTPRKGAEVLARLSVKAKGKCQASMAQPMEAPRPLSVKEQRLADLTTAYRANLLTPEQYQKERARIMAQP